MKSTRLGSERDAVSPVMGVVLMVAIVIILAAIVGTFVLETERLNDRDTPRAKFSFDYTGTASDGTEGYVEISFDSGDEIRASELRVRGDGIVSVSSTSKDDSGISSPDTRWSGADAYGAGSTISSGDDVYVGVESDYEIAVVWTSNDVDQTVTLVEDSGPDA